MCGSFLGWVWDSFGGVWSFLREFWGKPEVPWVGLDPTFPWKNRIPIRPFPVENLETHRGDLGGLEIPLPLPKRRVGSGRGGRSFLVPGKFDSCSRPVTQGVGAAPGSQTGIPKSPKSLPGARESCGNSHTSTGFVWISGNGSQGKGWKCGRRSGNREFAASEALFRDKTGNFWPLNLGFFLFPFFPGLGRTPGRIQPLIALFVQAPDRLFHLKFGL